MLKTSLKGELLSIFIFARKMRNRKARFIFLIIKVANNNQCRLGRILTSILIARGNSDYSVIAISRRRPRDELNHQRILLLEIRVESESEREMRS